MGESSAPNRIEIELTSNSGGTPWERPPSTVEGDPDRGSTAWRSEAVVSHSVGREPTRIWGPVIVAIVALALGWVLGRSGASGDASPTPAVASSSTSVAPPRSVAEPIAPVDPVVADPAGGVDVNPPVAGTEPPPDTTPEVTVEQVTVAESLVGMQVELVALGGGRRLLTLDLRTGLLETRVTASQPFGPATLFVDTDVVLLPSWDEDLASTLIPTRGAPVEVELGLAYQLRTASELGVIWRSDPELFDDKAGMVEQIGLDGSSLGVSVELPSAPLTADPAGGLVVAVPGAVFQVTPDGATPITTGRLVAIGRDLAIGYECDGPSSCDYVIIDRATGERSVLVPDPALGAEALLETTWTATSGSAFSADGRAVVVESVDPDRGGRRVTVVIDLETGIATEVAASPGPLPLAWAPDRRVLLYVLGGQLAAFDVENAVSNPVAGGLAGVEAFALRPIAATS